MSSSLFLLAVIAGLLHAIWNFASKKTGGNISVLWLGQVFGVVCCLPLIWLMRDSIKISLAALPYILATGLVHAFYFYYLGKSYQFGEISTVYPLARGIGVAGTSLLGFILLEESFSVMGLAGVGAVCSGIIWLGFSGAHLCNNSSALRYAIIVGLIITSYSIIDKVAVNLIYPVFYIFSQASLVIIFLAPLILRNHREELVNAWRNLKRYSAIVGIGSVGTYLLILFAFQLGPVGYIVAIRESSVAFGALLGFVWLREPFTLKKVMGIVAITAGLFLIKLG